MARGFGISNNNRGSGDDGPGSFGGGIRRSLQQVNSLVRTPTAEEVAEDNRELLSSFIQEQDPGTFENLPPEIQEYLEHDHDDIELHSAHSYTKAEAQENDDLSVPDEENNRFRLSPSSSNSISSVNSVTRRVSDETRFRNVSAISRPSSPRSLAPPEIGDKIRQIADAFAATPEREEIRKAASKVKYSIGKKEFIQILTNLFRDGNNIPERIVALLFFASDVVISTLKDRKVEIFKKFFDWSLSFLNDLVLKLGGWDKIVSTFGSFIKKTITFACICCVTVAAIIYIRKNW